MAPSTRATRFSASVSDSFSRLLRSVPARVLFPLLLLLVVACCLVVPVLATAAEVDVLSAAPSFEEPTVRSLSIADTIETSNMAASSHTEATVRPVLRAAVVITRHGDRTPIKTFPNTKSNWPEGLGQLTWLGMEQHYELGQKFRSRYVEEHGLIAPEYRGDEVYVRSTSKERTLMSAQSFMHGFFPPSAESKRLPGGLQPVPIHAFAKHHDIVLYAYKNCPRLKELQSDVKQGQAWKEMEEQSADLRASLSELFGAEITLKHMTSLATLVRQEITHNKTMIEGLNQEQIPLIKHYGEWVLRHKYATRDMGRLGSGKVFEEILNTLRPHKDSTTSEKKAPKFTLLSAHDGTLLALLTALGVPDFQIPPFAAHLVFELFTWPDDVTGERAFVKVLYNDEALSLNGCVQLADQCSFAEFEQVLKESSSPSWYEACGANICFDKEAIEGGGKKDKSKKKAKVVTTTSAVDDKTGTVIVSETVQEAESAAANLVSQLENQTPNRADGTSNKRKLREEEDPSMMSKIDLRFGGWEAFILAAGVVLGVSAASLKNILLASYAGQDQQPPPSKRAAGFKRNNPALEGAESGFSPARPRRTVAIKQT